MLTEGAVVWRAPADPLDSHRLVAWSAGKRPCRSLAALTQARSRTTREADAFDQHAPDCATPITTLEHRDTFRPSASRNGFTPHSAAAGIRPRSATSWHAANQGAWFLRLAGVDAMAVAAADCALWGLRPSAADALVLLSHRGTKRYTSEVLTRARGDGVPAVAIGGVGAPGRGHRDPSSRRPPAPSHALGSRDALVSLDGGGPSAARLRDWLGCLRAWQAQRRAA